MDVAQLPNCPECGSELQTFINYILSDGDPRQLYEGPRGGLYYVPSGDSDNDSEDKDGSSASEPFDEPVGDTFQNLTESEEQQETIEDVTQTWTGWPTDPDTAPMWKAAVNQTGNDNAPEDDELGEPITELPTMDENVRDFEDYQNNLQERLREEHGDTMELNRAVYGDVTEDVLGGEEVTPRTLESWTSDIDNIPTFGDEVRTPDGDLVSADEAAIVTMEVDVDNIMDHHAANPTLASQGEGEVVVGLGEDTNLSEGDAQRMDEVE